MTTWRFKSLGDGISAEIHTAEIETLFQPFFDAAGRPADMAILTCHEPGSLHCEVTAYFSPAAEGVALAVGAEPCTAPAPQHLELLAGTEDCWSVLFNEALHLVAQNGRLG